MGVLITSKICSVLHLFCPEEDFHLLMSGFGLSFLREGFWKWQIFMNGEGELIWKKYQLIFRLICKKHPVCMKQLHSLAVLHEM